MADFQMHGDNIENVGRLGEEDKNVSIVEIKEDAMFASSKPLRSVTRRFELENDEHLDVVLTVFTNRIVVIASQGTGGAIGNWVHAKVNSSEGLNNRNFEADRECNTVVSTRVIFGADEPWLHVVSSRVASELASSKPILCSFTIKQRQQKSHVDKILNIICDFIGKLKSDTRSMIFT